jgi:ABC-2 type transport system permease protein
MSGTDPVVAGPAGTTPKPPPQAADDVIHDIGFRHYDGARLGRGWIVRSLLIETFRGVFGLGRPARAKAMPWVLVSFLTVPPLITALVVVLTRQPELPIGYSQYPASFWLVVALFVGGAAPYCVSRDLRHGVMPLYLSRPMARTDYVLAKSAGLSLAVFGVLALGETTLLVGALLAELPAGEQITGWLGGLLLCALLAVELSALTLLIAAFTPRRGLGVAAIMTGLVVGSGMIAIIVGIADQEGLDALAQYLPALDPFTLVDGLASSLLGLPTFRPYPFPDGIGGVAAYLAVWAAVVGACLLLLFRRYRKAGV